MLYSTHLNLSKVSSNQYLKYYTYIHEAIMFKLKQINLGNQKQIYLLFNTQTTLPLLYSTLFILNTLKYKSESTQKTYIYSLKLWYEFWFKKHNETFCKYFYLNKKNPFLMIQELDAFTLFLENENQIDNRLILLTKSKSINYNTLSIRLRSIISFLEYLLNNHSHVHGQPISKEITQYRSTLAQKSKVVTTMSVSNYNNKVFKATSSFKSLTKPMRDTLYTLISPKANPPLFKTVNAQLRNFLIIHFLMNYGLRSGELLLLTTSSIKTAANSKNTYLEITETNDETDTRTSKPHIKNKYSVRNILLSARDAEFLKMYLDNIRSKEATNNMLFLSLQKPYLPLSQSSLKKIFKTVNDAMKEQFPQFFDSSDVNSIDKITPHICRHTWAYLSLQYNYHKYKQTHSDNDAMTNAMSNLRKMAGWSLNSPMPLIYANRFISEHANSVNIERITRG